MPAASSWADTVPMIPKTHWAETIDDAYIAYQDFDAGPITLVVIQGWITHLEASWEELQFARFMRQRVTIRPRTEVRPIER